MTLNYQLPIVHGISLKELEIANSEIISFNYALTCKEPKKYGVHFYIDDYQFERIWNNPKKYINLLKSFRFIIAPDFSLFKNFPKPLQIYNLYKQRVLAQFLQNNDIKVIPNVTWSDLESLNWTLDGMPKYSVVALSTNGCLNKATKKDFLNCYTQAMDKLKPTKIIIIGELPEELKNDKRILKFNSHIEKLHKIKKGGKL